MTEHAIALITDSTCDIPFDLAQRHAITILPHVIIWNGKQYRDKTDLSPEEFYRRLRTERERPTTSQASTHDFASIYRQAAEEGACEIVVISVASALSGAYQSALGAIAEAGVPVHLVDSRSATMGMGWQVLAAARAREAGGGVAEMLAAAEQVRKRVYLSIYLDTLEYVHRGGRIGNAGRLIGAMLNIKPLLTVNHDTGIVEPTGMAMTRKKGIEQMVQKFFAQMDTGRPLHVAVMHGDAAEDADCLMQTIREQYRPAELILNITGPALGINTGPLAIALVGYYD